MPAPDPRQRQLLTRRRALTAGFGSLAAVAIAGTAGVELVAKGVLPGHRYLNWLDGACEVYVPPPSLGKLSPAQSGTFDSKARNQQVGYTIAYPPGHGPGDQLPLAIALHGYGGDHLNVFGRYSPAQVLALRVAGRAMPPLAMVTVDGGGGYWNPHPGDNPMAMVIDELIPMCQRQGLGETHPIGTIGISMGGYGALLLAEKFPSLIGAAAAISPAVWTSYAQAKAVNPGAFAGPAAFASADVITHAGALAGKPVRVAAGVSDPFIPGVRALVAQLPRGAAVDLAHGCHAGLFAAAQTPPSIDFLARHLVS